MLIPSTAPIYNISKDHYPVMLKEVIDILKCTTEKSGVYLDCTFGAGGYSRAMLESNPHLKLFALDQDPDVKIYATELKKEFGARFEFIKSNFSKAEEIFQDQKFDGIALDLGTSSMQLDRPLRGFSFQKEGDLDMRMSQEGHSAADFINNASEEEIADVLFMYGDEKESRKIAKAIIEHRSEKRIDNTIKLAEIIRSAKKKKFYSKIDPATKSFQAIRIYVNKEIEVLKKFLESAEKLLAPGGRLVVVSFHSLEDSLVKHFFKEHSAPKVAKSKYAKSDRANLDPNVWLKMITKKPLTPSLEEVEENIRSRSAKLRVAERLELEDVG